MQLDSVVRNVKTQSQSLSGKMWGCSCKGGLDLIDAIGQWRTGPRKDFNFCQQRSFLIYLARWVVMRLDWKRRERHENKGD